MSCALRLRPGWRQTTVADPGDLLGVGWLLLCGFGALRALIVLGSSAAAQAFGVQDPRARLAAGLLSLAISALHRYQSIEIWTRRAMSVQGVAEARDAMRAVAAINLTLQSLRVLLDLSLPCHPIVVRFCEGRKGELANA